LPAGAKISGFRTDIRIKKLHQGNNELATEGKPNGQREERTQGGSQQNLDKVRAAVNATARQVLTYNGLPADTTYLSCSGGRTEDAQAVWGGSVPYLQAVDSPGEEISANYSKTVRFSAEDFVAIKLLYSLLALVILFAGALTGKLAIPFLMGVLIAVYPRVWMSATIKARQLSIMKALPNLLDVLTLSVESGRDLISSLRDILARRRPDALGEELLQAFSEIQLGRKRSEALKAMAERVRQIDLTATVNAICQADELGVSIGQQLRIQSDMQRQKRFSLAEKLANEASVKIIVPVVIFILPAVFIILLGPLLLQTARMFR
jgi:tight adherence protein C